MNPSLHSSKISLRAPEPEDIDEMMFFENDASFWENGPATGPYSRYQLKKYIAENQNDLFADGQLRLMIEHASGEVAGIIDVFAFDARHRRAETGIVVKPAYRRQGIAFEALAYWNNIVSGCWAFTSCMPTSGVTIQPVSACSKSWATASPVP